MNNILIKRRSHTAGADHNELPAALHPVLRRVYQSRNVSDPAQLERSLDRLLPPALLGGSAEAAALLHEVLAGGGRILVIGDFDADGATSSAVAVRALRMMGARDCDFLVPNRFEYGYGLTPEIVALAAQRRPELIITVDNGISSIDGVAAARALGIRVLITDHHLPGAQLPDADVIVNPNQPGDTFPSKHLAGVGVIFYVMLALRRHLREAGWFEAQGLPDAKLATLLDLVALGTVADVVTLDQNNRILVAQGLERIRGGVGCAGIEALIAVAKRSRDRIVAGDLGFALGPRLNAAGRLDDMSLGIECLLTDDPARASAIATRLDDLNVERRRIEAGMQTQALTHLEDQGRLEELAADAVSLCLYHAEWHQGVIGILASRIKDRVHRPVIAFAPAGDGEIKGSARSIPGLHIRDALDAVATRHPGLVPKFGGHAMAAGLMLRSEDLERFRAAFEHEVQRHLDAEQLQGVIYTDGELAGDELSLELAEQLRAGGPWGQGFPEPVFDGQFEVRDCRLVGDKHLKMVLSSPGVPGVIDAIAFNRGEDLERVTDGDIHVAYRLDVNEFRGQRSAQLIIEHISA